MVSQATVDKHAERLQERVMYHGVRGMSRSQP